jgi:cation:H+ antiporter
MGAALRRDTAVLMMAALLLVPVFALGQMGRLSGVILVAGLAAYLVWAYRQPGEAIAIAVSLVLTGLLLIRPAIGRGIGVVMLASYLAYVWAAQG